MKNYKLGDVVEIIPGYPFKSSDFGKGDNKVIKIKDIKPPFIDIENADTINLKPDNKYLLEKGDFVLAMTGATIGKVGLNISGASNIYINQRVCKFLPNNLCDKKYLYYLLNTEGFRKFILQNVDSSSAQPNIGHTSICQFEHLFPEIETQKSISHLLSVIDKKIAVNRQINDNLTLLVHSLIEAKVHLAA